MLASLQKIQSQLYDWFAHWIGMPESIAALLVAVISVAVVLFIALAVDRCVRWVIRSLVPSIVSRFAETKSTQWLKAIRDQLVARRSAHILAVLVFYWLIPLALEGFPETLAVVQNLIEGYVVIVAVIAINSLIRASGDVLVDDELPTGVSLRFFTQGIEIAVWVIGVILVTSVVFDKSVTVLLSGMAGMTAVLLLVFKDTILGFIAGIQLANNDMLRIDDWIEVPQYGANGTVTDIALTTVKVQNFDKTISTVPSYALVSESFRNWRGMKESGARRILRSIPVDMGRIGFLSDDLFDQLRKIDLLREYLDEKRSEIEAANEELTEEARHSPNARRLTNIGVFRAYVERYLKQHPDLRDDMTLIVQQNPPGPEGLPIQIVVFCKAQEAKEFERIQADIFDHVIAILPAFGLKAFQGPTSDGYLHT